MKRIFRAIVGLFLAWRKIQTFHPDVLRGKRIAIVGPASSAMNTGKGDYIDKFDLVVRVNKSVLVVQRGEFRKDIGNRTDILFHCFLENLYSGGGPLDFEMFDQQGIRYVVNPRNEWTGLRNSFNFYKKYLSRRTTYVLPKNLFNEISSSLKGPRPTTGYSALITLMKSDFKELFITGFTFFKTAYGDGYRDEMKRSDQARNFMKDVGLHDPDAEYKAFKAFLSKQQSKNIHVDDELRRILETTD
jgi:hypothetical protein